MTPEALILALRGHRDRAATAWQPDYSAYAVNTERRHVARKAATAALAEWHAARERAVAATKESDDSRNAAVASFTRWNAAVVAAEAGDFATATTELLAAAAIMRDWGSSAIEDAALADLQTYTH
jgi:hypothetical protein